MNNTRKPRILFIMQLPPPVHGASLMNQNLVNSKLIGTAFDTRAINITTARDIGAIGKFSVSKVFSMFLHFFRIAKQLVLFKPALVYFTVSISGFAFYRDAMYICLVKLFKPALVLHLHGKGIQAGAAGSRLFKYLSKKILSGTYSIHLSPLLLADTEGIKNRKRFVVANGIPVVVPANMIKETNQVTQLLYLSNYVKTKGIIDVIDAVALAAGSNRHFKLNLVGKPFDYSIAALEDYIKTKNVSDIVTVSGPSYGEEKYRELQRADVFIFPTYYQNEAFPISLLEAMQFRLAIITTDEGGIPDMIDNDITGYIVRKRDVAALAEKILFLLENPGKRNALGTAARKKFDEQYTIDHFEKNMLRVFTEVLESK